MTTTNGILQPWSKLPWLGQVALALLVVVLLTLFSAPRTVQYDGSSFSRAPGGYGAWYAFMQTQGLTIQRWQRPFKDLEPHLQEHGIREPVTLLRIKPDVSVVQGMDETTWIEQGNRLVLIGVYAPVTRAKFSTTLSSPAGQVKIDTKRRFNAGDRYPFSRSAPQGEGVLGDRFGDIVWRMKLGKGEVIYVCTPYLTANAYQDEPGNYPFLSQLVGTGQNSVWVDEFIHGYQDTDIITEQIGQTWHAYLIQTPLLLVLVQIVILLIIIVWSQNQRFGLPVRLIAPKVNNSRAYIDALAGVLQKANTSEFIVDVVGKEEQLQVQRALGLGTVLLDSTVLLDAWSQQTGRPAAELEQVFRPYWQKRRLNDKDLKIWLAHVQMLRQQLPVITVESFHVPKSV